MPCSLALLGPLGGWELVVLALLGLLIFGKRLPEVGKSLGKGIVEFKKGLSGIEDEMDQATKAPPKRLDRESDPTSVRAQDASSAPAGNNPSDHAA